MRDEIQNKSMTVSSVVRKNIESALLFSGGTRVMSIWYRAYGTYDAKTWNVPDRSPKSDNAHLAWSSW